MGTGITRAARLFGAGAVAAILIAAQPASAATRSPLGTAGRATPPQQLLLHGTPGALRPMQAHAIGYPGALWEPASPQNYTVADRTLGDVTRLIIHVAQGGFASTYTWFKNPRAEASAHYVVSSTGRVAQMVPEQDIAWHAGNWAYNVTSIGIEHAGYTNVTHFRDAEYRGSAALAGWVARRWLIPPDREHVIGHYQVPDPFHKGQFGGADHHTDPGRTWDWPRYMAYLRLDSGQTWSDVVDDAGPGVQHSAAWTTRSSAAAVGGSYLRTSSHRDDPVSYSFRLPQTDAYDVFAHFPCVRHLPTSARIGIETATGGVHVETSEQRCGTWRYLGTWTMTAGTAPRVLISSHSNGPSVVADAVQLVETTDPVPPAAVPVITTAATDGLSFSWPASSDNIGVGAYQLWADGVRVFEADALSDTVPLPCGTNHLVSLRVIDLAGNRSALRRFHAATLPCPEPVTGLAVTGVTQTTVALDWQNGGGTVAGYDVYYKGGALIGDSTSTSYTVTGLTCGTAYAFSVRAFDSTGDTSKRSVVSALTAAC
jgi:hypothetical protein